MWKDRTNYLKYVFHGMEKESARRVGDQTYEKRDTHGISESRSGKLGIKIAYYSEQMIWQKSLCTRFATMKKTPVFRGQIRRYQHGKKN